MLIDWNTNFTERNVAGATHKEILTRLYAALWERQLSVNAEVYPTLYAAALAPVTGGVIFGTPVSSTGQTWASLQNQILTIAKFFVRRFDDSGDDYTPDGLRTLDSPLYHQNDDGSKTKIVFPYPNGWERHYPREIYTLSQSGTDGQRARFTARIGTVWLGCSRSDPLFNTTVTTPEIERVNSTKYFDRIAGEWVLSDDQSTDADEIIEFAGANWDHKWLTGDYFGWWNINDARDALNQLVRIPAFFYYISGVFGVYGLTSVEETQRFALWQHVDGRNRFGSGFDRGQTEDSYDAASELYDAGAYTMMPEMFSNDPTVLSATKNRLIVGIRSFGGAPATWPNPTGLEAEMSYWIWPEPPYGGTLEPLVGVVYEFDSGATGLTNEVWNEVVSRQVSDDTTLASEIFGDIPTDHTGIDWPASGDRRGYQARRGMVLFDYAVIDGFEFSELT